MLFWHYWRRERGGLIGWAVATVALIVPSVAFFEVLVNSDSMQELVRVVEQMPPALQALLGGSLNLANINGWLQTQVFSMLVPLLFVLHMCLGAVTILTRETDSGTLEFLLALPARRSTVILTRLAALAVNSALLHGVALGAIALGARLIGREADFGGAALVLLNSWLACLAAGALLLAISVYVDDYQRGQIIGAGVALVLFFVPAAIEPDATLGGLRGLSFFAYYRPAEVMAARAVAAGDVAVLVGAVAVLVGASLWLFGRRQLPA